MYKNRFFIVLIGMYVLLSSNLYAELDKRTAKKVHKSIKNKKTADFIIKNSKRVRFRGNNLHMLDMSRQGITSLPKGFSSIKSLKELRLNGNNLGKVPSEILSLINLERLQLGKNNIYSVPDSIASLSSLTHLGLSNNSLNKFPKAVLSLKKLESLSLIGNDIESIPKNISILTSLERLDMFANKLNFLPESICELSNLEKLSLSENKITRLPECIGDLSQVRTLHLYGNRLKTLPDSIVKLTNAFMFSLNRNQLTTLPDNMGNLVKMKHLNLEGNKLKILPRSLQKLENLESIGNVIGDKTQRYKRKKGESLYKFFNRCYQVKWRTDGESVKINRKRHVSKKDNDNYNVSDVSALSSKEKREDLAYEAGRLLGRALIGGLTGEDKENDSYEEDQEIYQTKEKIINSKHIKITTSEPLSGTSVSFEYKEMPGNQGDWIALTKAGLADNTYGEYFYPYGKKSGTHTFSGVPAGKYEIRVYYDWPSGGYVVQDRLEVNIK